MCASAFLSFHHWWRDFTEVPWHTNVKYQHLIALLKCLRLAQIQPYLRWSCHSHAPCGQKSLMLLLSDFYDFGIYFHLYLISLVDIYNICCFLLLYIALFKSGFDHVPIHLDRGLHLSSVFDHFLWNIKMLDRLAICKYVVSRHIVLPLFAEVCAWPFWP